MPEAEIKCIGGPLDGDTVQRARVTERGEYWRVTGYGTYLHRVVRYEYDADTDTLRHAESIPVRNRSAAIP